MKKSGLRQEKEQKSRELPISKLYKDEDIQVFKILLNKLKKKYNLSSTDVLNIVQEEILVPSSIFNKKLSPLETVVKYLKENLSLDYSKTAKILGRNRKTIWQAYKNSAKKLPEHFLPKETKYSVPVSVLYSDFSILEAVVVYLKDQFNLSYHQIGELIQRNERTVWTVYSRAKKKKGVDRR